MQLDLFDVRESGFGVPEVLHRLRPVFYGDNNDIVMRALQKINRFTIENDIFAISDMIDY